ncbi:signal transduction histidine kinase [Lipingzhangella halophila]|uniref:histidine kinase n=1 Tax=Lipingzhangella halophila TaxID=1783352 RepID=A0A7W7W183_9ACTN|nr:histidine kinase [Lipingzhangella halophila]MBB4929489.1 signal transduction histidine kinase [Lipingzhangella halophila]
MAYTLSARARARVASLGAEIAAERPWRERLVALLHLLTSFALSLGYLVPVALLVGSAVWLGMVVVGTASEVLALPPVSLLVSGAVLFLVLVPAAATLLARLACAIQRSRLENVYGIVETRTPDPTAPSAGPARLLSFVFGRDAWTALVYSTVAAVLGIASGAVVLGLVGFGIGGSVGALVGLGYLTVEGSLSQALGNSALPAAWVILGPPAAILGISLVPLLLKVEVVVTRKLLFDAPEVRVRRQLLHLRDSRSRMVDAAEAERRRIERDLHDGAQQRLLSVTMTLSRAHGKFDRDPDAARALLEEAQSEARSVMAELRDIARGLHPRVLTDHGLEAALPVAAGRSPLPIRLDVDMPERPSPRAEGVAYYVTCEALNNVAKHAGAENATVRARRVPDSSGDLLRLTVTDDGTGGADPDTGTGLYGLWDRVNAVDGELRLHSPAGGGTVLTADIPWEA